MRIIVPENEADKRVDVFISEKFDITRSAVQKMIENGGVFVNNLIKEKNYKT